MTSHIKRRGSTYYAQIAVPLDVQAIIGRKTEDRSLRTKDPHEAKRRLPDVLKEWHRKFDDARRGVAIAKEQRKPLTNAQMAARLYKDQIALDGELRAQDHRYASFEVDPDEARRFRDGLAGKLSNAELAELVGNRIERFRIAGHHDHAPNTLEWRALAQDLCAARYEAMAREAERAEGDFTGKPSHPTIASATPEPEQAPKGETIIDLFDRYARENAKGISADTLTQARRDVKLFADTIGNIPPAKITGRHVGEWKDLLMQYPVKAAEIAAFRGLTMRQTIKKNETVKKPTISDRTVNRYLSAVGAFCDWLVLRGYLDRNPVTGLHQSIDKTKRSTVPFTSDQLNALFSSPLFTGCQNDDDWHQPGNVRIRDHRYWIPLVMLFSGARPGEIAQLAVGDVRQEHGHWIMHITEEGDGDKSVKTKGSMRVVPIHPELVRLGFLKYHAAMKSAGETRLFPRATRNQRGQMVADFSRDFGRYLTRIKIKNGRGLSLYSFRHGAADALRRAGHLDQEFGFILGHTSATMTGRYGIMPQGMLQQRVELVNSISYPGLKIDHLR
jgi:integrase